MKNKVPVRLEFVTSTDEVKILIEGRAPIVVAPLYIERNEVGSPVSVYLRSKIHSNSHQSLGWAMTGEYTTILSREIAQ